MTLVVVQDPKDRDREDAYHKRLQELQELIGQAKDPDPPIVQETTCPTCGQKRYIPWKKEDK